MENHVYDTTSQILFLGFLIGLIFSYSGFLGFFSGMATGVLLEKNVNINLPDDWITLNRNNSAITTFNAWLRETIKKCI